MTDSPPFVAIDVSAVHPIAGGGHTYAHLLTRYLPAQGIDPLCVTRSDGNSSEWDGCGVLPIAPTSRLARLVWEQTQLLRTLHDAGPAQGISVLHSIHYTMPERPRLVDGLARVVTIHDLTFFSRPQDHTQAKRLFFRRAISVAAQRADHLICVSERTARELLSTVKVSVPVEVIPHGIDRRRFAPDAPHAGDDAAVLAELGIRAPFVLHLGTLEPRKNVGRLIEALAQVRSRAGNGGANRNAIRKSNAAHNAAHKDLSLVLAGGAWPGVREALPTPDGLVIHHLGVVRDAHVPALLRRAECVAYPSLAEGYGLPVIEALSCGASVVTSTGSVMEELAGEAAIYADPMSTDDLARALSTALAGEGPDRSTRLAVAAQHDVHESARRHAELYRRLA